MKISADVCVVGTGGGGLAAAVKAAELGAGKVVVLEKMKRIGGSTVRPRGMFAVNSPLQERHGRFYNPDEFYREIMFMLCWDVDAKLVRKWVTGTGETIRWLESEGAVFNRLTRVAGREPDMWLVHHMIADERGDICTGRKIVDTLTKRCGELGIDIYKSTPARHLKTDENGRVIGVIAEGPDGEVEVEAKAVILATGSISANKDLIASFYDGSHAYDDVMTMANFPSNTGDGLIMAEEIGGKRGCVSPLFIGPNNHYPGHGAISGKITRRCDLLQVNYCGERYVDENLCRADNYGWMMAQCLDHQPDKRVYLLVDQNMIAHMKRDYGIAGLFDTTHPVNVDARGRWSAEVEETARKEIWPEDDDWRDQIEESLDTEVANGHALKTDSLDEIAAYIGCSAKTLKKTVSDFNYYCRTGYDREFVRDPASLVPFSKPPYYVMIGDTAVDTFIGGLLVDNHQHVMSVKDRPIPGLYAAGVMTSGWLHKSYAFPGSELSYTLFSGLNAAVEAVESLKEQEEEA